MAILRVTVGLTYQSAGSPGCNVWHLRLPDGFDPLALTTQLTSLRTFYQDIATLYHNSTTIRCPDDVVNVSNDPPTNVAFSDPAAIVGTSSAGEAPALLCFCASWKTTVRTRSGSGRTFIGPLASSYMDTDGTPSNNGTGILRTAAKALILRGQAPAADGAYGVYSRTQNVIRDFIDVSVSDSRYASMKSRQD